MIPIRPDKRERLVDQQKMNQQLSDNRIIVLVIFLTFAASQIQGCDSFLHSKLNNFGFWTK